MPDLSETASRMQQEWEARAREAPEHYINDARRDWQQEEFFRTGQINVENEILHDDEILRLGEYCRSLPMLEIGCGAGRMTRAMAAVFGEVHAVDISAEMIALARRNLAGLNNVHLYKNNGHDLAGLPDNYFGFAFSFIVFQHIPSLEVIQSYIREVHRCLRPGAVFKFQVQGDPHASENQIDTWTGVPVSRNWAADVAHRCGFEIMNAQGEGTQYFWLWFRKPGPPLQPVEELLEPVAAAFSPASIRRGEIYTVRVPALANQAVDVTWELQPSGLTGVLPKWCELDAQGEARIAVPADHPASIVRITRLRSSTPKAQWHPTDATIEVVAP